MTSRMRKTFAAGSLMAAALLLLACQPKEITSAKIYMQGGRWSEAQEQLEMAVKQHPRNPEAHYLLGRAYGQRARYDDMNQEYDTALALSDDFREAVNSDRELYWIEKYNKGLAALDQRKYDQAEHWFRTAIRIIPTRYEAYKKLAGTYLDDEKPDEAATLYATLLDKDPENVELLLTTANIHYSQKQYRKAIPLLIRVSEISPNHRDALANLAFSHDALGQTEHAGRAYEQAIAANPNDQDLIFLFAAHHYRKQDFTRAIELFQQVLDLSPNEFVAISNIGNAYLGLAEKLRTQLPKPDSIEVTRESLLDLKTQVILNFKHAIPFLEKSLLMQPDHPNLWRNLGVAYFNTGKVTEGERAFAKAEELSLQPATEN